MKITLETLAYYGACHDQKVLFAAIFPDGAEVNEENYDKALEGGLFLYWFLTFFASTRDIANKANALHGAIWDLYYGGEWDGDLRDYWMAKAVRAENLARKWLFLETVKIETTVL